MTDAQPTKPRILAYTQIVSWLNWQDEAMRTQLGKMMLEEFARHAEAENAKIDWDTLVGPTERGRQWMVDTGEDDPDWPGETLRVFLPAPPDEDPDADPALIMFYVEAREAIS